MDIGATFVADGQPPEAIEPGQGAFHHPAMATQALAGVDALPGNADPDVPLGECAATARNVVGLVGMQLVRAFAAVAVGLRDGGNGIKHLLKDRRLVLVGWGRELGQRPPAPFGQNMPFGARFAAVSGVGTDEVAPLLAGMLAQSSEARLQSIWPTAPSRSSKVRCSASQTPASCQSRSRRQQVIPEPHPISWGSSSQGMPLLSTKMMPVKQARSGTRGRPPWGLGGSGGSSGATIAHNSSLTSGLAMPQVYHASTRF